MYCRQDANAIAGRRYHEVRRRRAEHARDHAKRLRRPPAGRVDSTTIDSLHLKVGRRFGYWFDFGDDWWHQINVEAIEEKRTRATFPKIIKRVGKSPPQYVDWDKEDE
jgi:hypothetical protein